MVKEGTQIIYYPMHAWENGKPVEGHQDAEPGFVEYESNDGKTLMCRYWNKYEIKRSGQYVLRTLANGEWTPAELVVFKNTVPQMLVDDLIASIAWAEKNG